MANSPLLNIPLLATSQAAKEATINTMVSYLERATNDAKTLAFAAGNLTLPAVDLQRYFMFKISGAGASSVLTITAMKRIFAIDNLANGNPLTINCGTDTLTIPVGGVVMVFCDGTSLFNICDSTVNGGSSGVTNFIGLSDTPNNYSGFSKYAVRVKEDLTGLEFVRLKVEDIHDIDTTGIAEGYSLKWDATNSKFVVYDPISGAVGSPYWKNAVIAATTVEIDFAETVGVVIDGVSIAEGDAVLVKDQSDQTTNGIWELGAGSWSRRVDSAIAAQLPLGAAVSVGAGVNNGLTTWYVAAQIGIIGTNPIIFQQNDPLITLSTIDDIDMTTPPSDGQVLTWDNTLSGAKFKDPASGVPDPAGQEGKFLGVVAGVPTWQTAGANNYPDMTGKAGYDLTVNSTATDVEWTPKPTVYNDVNIGVFVAGTMTADELVLVYTATVGFTLPNSFTGSLANSTDVSTGTVAFTLKKNGTSIGSITFTSANTGTFSGAGSTFVAGDKLTIEAPTTPDATLKNVSISLKGTRT